MLGSTVEEFIGAPFTDYVHPDEISNLYDHYTKRMAGEDIPSVYETVLKHKDGGDVYVEINAGLIKYNGQPANLVIVRDVTERKRAEDALLASEEKYRKLFENAVDGIAIADIHTGELIDCNKALAELVGRDKSELIGQHQSILHPKEHLEGKFTKTFPRHGLNKEGRVLETQVITKTGIIKDVEIKANTFEIEGCEILQGIFHDITDRKKAEEKLKLHQDRLNISLELHKMSDAPVDEILDYVLEACLKTVESEYAFIGLMNEDETVLSIHLWSEDVMKECAIKETPIHFPISGAGMWGECVRQRRPIIVNDYETSKLYKKGYPRGHVQLERFLAVPVFEGERIVAVALAANKKEEYDNDDLIAFNSLLNDMWKLIQRKNSENQLIESLKEKEVLLSEIHHRVKNNLQIITSLLNLQSQNLKNEYDMEVFTESQNRVKSMALIHERLYQTKDFAHINMAEHIKRLASGLFNTYHVDQTVVKLNTNIQDVKFNIETAIPLSLIINELVTNSIKHAFHEGQDGEINIDLVETDEKSYKLTISDNGVGIPPDIDFQKTGTLGLQLVNNLTTQLDGVIKLDKTRGTQFEIEFNELIYPERK